MLILEIIGGLLLAIWLYLCWLIWSTQKKLIFPADGAPFEADYPQLSRIGAKHEKAERDGQALRWFDVPASAEATAGKPAKGILLVFHGNRGGAAERYDYARHLCPQGWRVVLAEFPGYAGGGGECGEWEVLRNGMAMYDEIESRRGGLPLVLFGESMGTGSATLCAFKRNPAALVLSTPYPSMTAVAKARFPYLPIYKMMRHPIDTRLWAPHVRCPVMIVHGTKDKTIPYKLGLAQAANFQTPPNFLTIEGAAHGNLRDFNAPLYWGELKRFLGTVK